MVTFFLPLFPETDKSAWLTQVRKEFKPTRDGDDAYESLRWHTEEGFTLEPYYTANDLANGPLTDLPLKAIQAAQKQNPGWLNAPDWVVGDEKSDNTSLRDVLTRGADALILTLSTQTERLGDKLSRLLNGIKLSEKPVYFRLLDDTATDFVRALKTIAPYKLKGGLLMAAGKSTAEATRLTVDSPQFRTICVSSHAFHNAGATATQELAFTLASLADTYDQLTNNGLTIEQLVPKTILSVSVGTSYFLEIAKLRALRVLLGRMVGAYGSTASSFFVHCQTSTFYDAKATPNTNLLRATTEAMAAVIGGCDALTVHPYDTVLGTPETLANDPSDKGFAARIARNVSVLLKEESYLDKVADPSAGSYYIENLTHSLAEAAWTLFLTVENQGGFAKAVANNFIQSEVERAYQAKVDAVRKGKVLVGVTKFRFDEPSTQTYNPLSDQTGLLPDRRLAEVFE